MKTKDCEIFKNIKLTDEDRAKMLPVMTNWSKVASFSQEWGEEELCKAILLELESKARTNMLQRLVARYNVVRGHRISREVFSSLA